MVFPGERYYNIYRIMLTAIGLWPYQTSKRFVQAQTTFFFGACSFFLFFQFMTFLTTTCSLKFVIKEISYIFIIMMYIISYNSFYFNANEIKQLLEQIKLDWNTVEDNEVKILEKYSLEVHLFSLFLAILVGFAISCLIIIECVPIILDTVAPINESRPRKVMIDFEFFINKEKYFYIYLIYEVIVVMIGILTMISTGTLSIAFMRHCCATYKIAINLIENTVTKYTLQIPAHRKAYVMYKKINRAVHIHRKSIQFSEVFMSAMSKWYFLLMVISVVSLSCNLFRLLNAATVLTEFSELLMCFGMVTGNFIVTFVPNFVGQSLINHSGEMFNAAYNTMWYLAPLPIQKLLLFVMQNSLKTHSLVLGGIYVSSLEGFSTLTTTSISYFTVMYSLTMK